MLAFCLMQEIVQKPCRVRLTLNTSCFLGVSTVGTWLPGPALIGHFVVWYVEELFNSKPPKGIHPSRTHKAENVPTIL